jgi:signal transduction histidine kinase
VRVAVYWLACLFAVALMLGCIRAIGKPPHYSSTEWLADIWLHDSRALLASLLVLPFILLDCAVVSNRFVGPLRQVRRTIKQLADGRHVGPVQLRKGDFLGDLAQDVNRLTARWDALQNKKPGIEAERQTGKDISSELPSADV